MNMARAPVVREVHTTDDLTTQVRNARHVVESDNRVHRVTRRDHSSSSSSGSRRRVVETVGHRIEHDVGRRTTTDYVRHHPTTTIRTHASPTWSSVARRTVISPGGTRRTHFDSHNDSINRSHIGLNDSQVHGTKTV